MQDAFAALQNSGAPIKQALNEGNHIHVAFNQPQGPVDPLDAALAVQASPRAQQQSGNYYPPGDSRNSPAAVTVEPLDAALAQQASAKPVAAPPSSQTSVQANNAQQPGWVDTALHYATGGGMDKIDALMQTAGALKGGAQVGDFGTRYHQNLTNIRNAYGEYSAANPTADKYAHAAGVVGPMIATMGGSAATSLLPVIAKNTAIGAAYGFGGTDDSSLTGDLGAAGMGGLLGGTIGAAGHGVGSLAGSAGGAMADRFAGVSQTPGQRYAANTITANLPDGMTPADLIAQLSGTAKPLTPMDIGGENSPLARQGRMLTVLPGQPGKDITDFLNARQTGAPGLPGQRGRVLGDISKDLAPNADIYGTAADLRAEQALTHPLYKTAFDAPANLTDELAVLQTDPDIQRGMREGIATQRRYARGRGIPFDPNSYGVTSFNSAGDPVIGPTPNWRTWHAARMGLDNIIDDMRNDTTGELPRSAGSWTTLRSGLDTQIKEANPAFNEADAAFADPAEQLGALTRGRKFLNADPEEIAIAQGRMSPKGIDAHRVGGGRALRDIANDTRDNNNIPQKLNGDQTTRDQISAMYGPDAGANFAGNMNLENQMAQTRNFVLKGSNSINKLSDLPQKGGASQIVQDAISGALAGGLHGAMVLPAVNLARRASMNWAENLLNNPNKNAELAKVLTAKGPDAAAKIQHLLAAAQRRQRAAAIGKAVGNAGGRGVIAGTLPALMTPAANNGP